MWLYLTVDVSVFADACVTFACASFFWCVCNYVSVPCMCDGGETGGRGGGGSCMCTHAQKKNTEVGNILMSTVKQEIGNTFKSLALSVALGSQSENQRASPASSVTGCVAERLPVLAVPHSARLRYVPSRPRTGARRRLYPLGQLSNSRSGNLGEQRGRREEGGSQQKSKRKKNNAVTLADPKRAL